MKRFRRWGFDMLAAMSLLLCVAMVALWVSSYWREYDFDAARDTLNGDERHHIWWRVASAKGAIGFKLFQVQGTAHDARDFNVTHQGDWTVTVSRDVTIYHPVARWKLDLPLYARRSYWHWGGFTISNTSDTRFSVTIHSIDIVVPHWSFALLAIILPSMSIWSWRIRRQRRKRQERRLCLVCGYDLRASKDRCPECGVAGKAAE